MAQTEDTELRDLVLEALEKNGSLAKIRALLRANVFMAFEDECDKIKHNISLDNILKVPEGILTLSLVHEFLEFCNLKNTLFVYMSETRQGREYSYEGQKSLSEKLHSYKKDQTKEPLLVSIIKNVCSKLINKMNENMMVNKDDQNCTYIVHEDSSPDSSSNQSNTQSDQSCDEKKQLQLRLPLDNSDTDTSSDYTRDKTSSEYIPNEHIVICDESEDDNKSNISQQSNVSLENKKINDLIKSDNSQRQVTQQYQVFDIANTSSQSTSYIDIKPLNSFAQKLLYVSDLQSELPAPEKITDEQENPEIQNIPSPKADSSVATISEVTSISSKQAHNTVMKKFLEETHKSAANTPEYTYDFSSSPPSNLEINTEQKISLGSVQDNTLTKNFESPRQNSQSSQSSVSISDVADLLELSEANSPLPYKVENGSPKSNVLCDSVHGLNKKSKNDEHLKSQSDDSSDFTESSIPSLSNLSLHFQ